MRPLAALRPRLLLFVFVGFLVLSASGLAVLGFLASTTGAAAASELDGASDMAKTDNLAGGGQTPLSPAPWRAKREDLEKVLLPSWILL